MDMYNLSFYEAIEKCCNGEGFIRGENFKDGVYVKKVGETLVAVDAFDLNHVIGNLYVSEGILSQKYKLFKDIADEELRGSRTAYLYRHAI